MRACGRSRTTPESSSQAIRSVSGLKNLRCTEKSVKVNTLDFYSLRLDSLQSDTPDRGTRVFKSNNFLLGLVSDVESSQDYRL